MKGVPPSSLSFQGVRLVRRLGRVVQVLKDPAFFLGAAIEHLKVGTTRPGRRKVVEVHWIRSLKLKLRKDRSLKLRKGERSLSPGEGGKGARPVYGMLSLVRRRPDTQHSTAQISDSKPVLLI